MTLILDKYSGNNKVVARHLFGRIMGDEFRAMIPQLLFGSVLNLPERFLIDGVFVYLNGRRQRVPRYLSEHGMEYRYEILLRKFKKLSITEFSVQYRDGSEERVKLKEPYILNLVNSSFTLKFNITF